ncbi:superfamily I DNA/RNA helicase [Rhizobium azooxidifex]|uniref:DNA 3'-5' helicase n=1 Tax=Mycoplana azooxidifex TaxID=1636188 RepID=A0A7W6D798_9HYPH|nr:ATP-dependent helicase [Mycoplana azooxidifex]MBB3978051.1 superfamily I DNA/RNA helicase [Mycoplana azooxidifex]
MAWDTGLDQGSVAYGIAAAPEPRVRVIAGPGTGKSFAMKRRVARLLESGIAPDEILAVTFTRVAAEDLHRELQKLDTPGCEELQGQTLHSLAMRILSRKHVLEAVGRAPRPLNAFETKAMICDLAGDNGGKRLVRSMIQGYMAAWAQSQGDEPGFAKTNEEKQFQAHLLDWLDFHQGMLIGELIPYLVRYLRDNPAAAERTEFRHLLIDEFQDLNKAEQTVLYYLGEAAEICIVGDDDQSIYSFKNAHPDGIREWKNLHPECADLEMADCHRCPTTVVDMANALIAVNKNRQPRALNPLQEKGPGEVAIVQVPYLSSEAKWITNKVAGLLESGVHPSEIIILVQRAVAGRPILESLRQAGVPAKSYYEESQLASEVAQERFATFKLLLNNEDRVALRYLLGAGDDEFRRNAYARVRTRCEASGDSPWTAMHKLADEVLTLPYTKPLVERFKAIQAELDALNGLKTDLPAFVDALFPTGDENLSELRDLALAKLETAGDPGELLGGMMEEITQPDIPPTVEEVRLMSLHKSKGLSSPFVFVAGCVEGILPPAPDPDWPKAVKDAALEEARRLFYVGITRVKSDLAKGWPGSLFISYPQQMSIKDAYGANVAFRTKSGVMANLLPSRFLGELGAAAPKPIAGGK